ncbi:MAG: hypothetical protein US42_C0015G0004 [Candidatus Magasanikbacteria bacterium GW2011_GWC2_37_14]|uniref:Cwf19-like C-terminal domain-containing protein n=1 Tax=Candidatus Magasanikbacteria bacterium GW2011_GWC2_37_14 TaxID=1619046 RepID=A0A0G0JFX9_9BACT|nr:MAG: hypothetical protein US42_C0015G0004 [Candidatus Magasanikbacteria bacterium GW2011_GWC2_37_14]
MDCIFCNKNKISDEILLQTENFYLVPALGSFIPDYLLIVSQNHLDSLGQILINQDITNEFESLLKQVKKFIGRKGQKIIAFEHGATQHDKAGCCIGHAHIHILPFDKILTEKIENILDKKSTLIQYEDINDLTGHGTVNYLLLEENEKINIWKNVVVLSQFMRRLIARETNKANCFDWKTNPFREIMLETIDSWKEHNQKL